MNCLPRIIDREAMAWKFPNLIAAQVND